MTRSELAQYLLFSTYVEVFPDTATPALDNCPFLHVCGGVAAKNPVKGLRILVSTHAEVFLNEGHITKR